MRLARHHLTQLSEVWYAEMEDAPHLRDRLRSRRRPQRGGGGTLVVRRDDNRLHCFSTRELGGRDEPRDWERLCSEEPLERLAATLALPGVKGARWSKSGWPTTHSDKRTDNEASYPREPWIALPTVGRDRHDVAREFASELAHTAYGVTPGTDGIPTDEVDPYEWANLIKIAVRVTAPSR